MVLETFEELVGGERGGAEFAHDDAAGVVGDFGSLDRRGARAEGKGVESDGRVARAGNIEDLARPRRRMIPHPVAGEEKHPELTQRDEQLVGVPFGEEKLAHLEELFVFERMRGRLGPRDARGGERFVAVGFDHGDTVPGDGVAGVGIDGDRFSRSAHFGGDLLGQITVQQALAVVLDDDGVDMRQRRIESPEQRVALGLSGAIPELAVDAHDLLGAGDDPRLHRGRPAEAFHHAHDVDAARGKQFAQAQPRRIARGQSEHRGVRGEFAEVAGHIGRPAGIDSLAVDRHHGDRGLRGNTGDFAPNELVKHQVPRHENAAGGHAFDDFLHTRGAGDLFHDRLFMLYLGTGPSEISHILKTKALCALAGALFAAGSACAAPPAERIDLSQFPAETVNEVVVPVPSEVFSVLEKLGNPNWRAELGPAKTFPATADRAQDALLLGTVIADGFIAVEAQDSERVKDIGRNVLTLAEAINVRKSVVSRSNSIIEKADARNWDAVRREFDGALQDVNQAMAELNDEQLAQLVSLGGWLRGTEALTSIVDSKYSIERAELLHQPLLVDYFLRQLSRMSPRLRGREIVGDIRRTLDRIDPLIQKAGGDISPEAVAEIHNITSDVVGRIRSKAG